MPANQRRVGRTAPPTRTVICAHVLHVVALVAVLLTSSSQPASAQCREPSAPSARTSWRFARFAPWQYVLTGSAWLGTVAIPSVVESPRQANWGGPILFDNAAHELLMLESGAGRQTAGLASDILMGSLVAYSLTDAFLVAGQVCQSLDIASQLLLLELQSFGISTLSTAATKNLVSRERIANRLCHERTEMPACDREGSHQSFYSGHAALAFTAAGLTCARHRYVPLYGGLLDDLTCAVSIGVASAVGALRIAADEHYLSDVVAGASVGFASGYLLPTLLHFERAREPRQLRVGMIWAGGPFFAAAGTL